MYVFSHAKLPVVLGNWQWRSLSDSVRCICKDVLLFDGIQGSNKQAINTVPVMPSSFQSHSQSSLYPVQSACGRGQKLDSGWFMTGRRFYWQRMSGRETCAKNLKDQKLTSLAKHHTPFATQSTAVEVHLSFSRPLLTSAALFAWPEHVRAPVFIHTAGLLAHPFDGDMHILPARRRRAHLHYSSPLVSVTPSQSLGSLHLKRLTKEPGK